MYRPHLQQRIFSPQSSTAYKHADGSVAQAHRCNVLALHCITALLPPPPDQMPKYQIMRERHLPQSASQPDQLSSAHSSLVFSLQRKQCLCDEFLSFHSTPKGGGVDGVFSGMVQLFFRGRVIPPYGVDG